MHISLTLLIIIMSFTAFFCFCVGFVISYFFHDSAAASRRIRIIDDSVHGEAVRVFDDEGLIGTFPRHTGQKLKVMFDALCIRATLDPPKEVQ
jgi:hypothetical protein